MLSNFPVGNTFKFVPVETIILTSIYVRVDSNVYRHIIYSIQISLLQSVLGKLITT